VALRAGPRRTSEGAALGAQSRFRPGGRLLAAGLQRALLSFAAEYKGEHLRNMPREIEKGQVGKVWADASQGKAVFAMLFKLERGMNVLQQIEAVLS